MARQTFVQERVVGAVKFQQTAILANEIVEERLGFLFHQIGQILVEVWKVNRIRTILVDVLQAEPLRSEPSAERFGSGIGKHAASLFFEFAWFGQPSLRGNRLQFLVGRSAPQEKR